MKRDDLSEHQAQELIGWWEQIKNATNPKDRQVWLDVYEQRGLTQLASSTRAKLEMIAQLNRRTMPKEKEEGGNK